MSKSVAVFGTGSAFKDFLNIIDSSTSIVGLGDNDSSRHGTLIEGHKVYSPESFSKLKCDLYVIAARDVDKIRGQLVDLKVDPNRICAFYPSFSQNLVQTINSDISKMNSELNLSIPKAGIATMYVWPGESEYSTQYTGVDFVRNTTFRLMAEQINSRNIPGSIAELGVYQGDQAAQLNRLFPDRKLHLFDTFEGFSSKDLSTETVSGFSGAKVGDFKNTSVELVMSKMLKPEHVVLHQGYFPETAVGVEDKFSFVSLDVDLYEPTVAGLNWFYPRLSKGGVIFVHDFNNRRYLGVRAAVEEFALKTGATTLPMADFSGSVAVLK